MSTALQKTENHELEIPTDVSVGALEMAIGQGDFSRFTPADKLRYLTATCQSLRLNALTLPIRIIKMDGREVMYATAECSAQLAYRDKVSVKKVEEKTDHDCYVVRVVASLPDGRSHEDIGVVEMLYPDKTVEWKNGQKIYIPHPKAGKPFEGKDWANAVMKCHTKASRRAVLRICSLAIPDETELDEMPRAQVSAINTIVNEESVQSRADKLNEAIEVESHQPNNIEVLNPISQEPKGATPKVQPIVSATVPVPQAASNPIGSEQPAAPDDFPIEEPKPEVSEDEKFLRSLETVLSESPNSIPYLIAQNKLKKGEDIAKLDRKYAEKVISHAGKFHSAVAAWANGGKK